MRRSRHRSGLQGVQPLVVTANLVAVAEALVLAASLGADPARVRDALLGGYAATGCCAAT
jgi:3-hydroxyisobutyrate dehydrogenase-like beta-hydroxyacid dehydrogenase